MLKYSNEMFRVEAEYINRSRIYLYPAVVLMKSYPQIRNLKESFLCVSFAHDSIIIYYRRDNGVGLKALIEALKSNDEYMDSYMHNENVYAIRVSPEINYSAFESGSYSDIYTQDQIDRVFTKDGKTRKILEKNPEYKAQYVKLLNEWFNTNHTVESLESRANGRPVEIQQYDIPPVLSQEILNYERQKNIKGGFIRTPAINES